MERKSIHIGRINDMSGVTGIIYGLLATLLAMLLLSLLGSAVVFFSRLPESSLYIIAVLVNVLALFAGGFIAGRKGKSRGLVRGLIVGVVVLALMVAFGSVPLAQLAMKAGYCLPAAALGGVCGVK